MAEHAFTELGYFDIHTCNNLQAALDEESYLEFLVDWSNEAGNCTLVVRSGVDNHPDGSEVTEDELRDLFTHVALDKLANSLDESICVPKKLNDLAKRVVVLGAQWEHMVCAGDDRAPFVMAQMEQIRNELDNEKAYLRRRGYKVAYDSDDKMFYAIKGDTHCPVL